MGTTPFTKQKRGGLLAFDMASSLLVQAASQEVWEVFRDAAAGPTWSRICTRVWGLSPDLWAAGSRLSFRLRMAGVQVPFSVHVTESLPPHRVAWASTRYTVTAVRTFTFEAQGQLQGNATLVTDHKRFSSPFLPIRLLYPRWLIRDMTAAWLGELKVEAERRAGI